MDTITETVSTWIQLVAHDPLMLMLVLAIATFVTEDGALVAGSLLVGSSMVSPSLIILALASGILVGDLALYALGWSARTNRFIRKRLPINKTRGIRRWLKAREATVLFVSRFTPGTRLITYVTYGFLKLSIIRFVIVMMVAGIIWVSSAVFFISEIQQILASFGTWPSALVAALCGITFIVLVPRLSKRLLNTQPLQELNTEGSDAR